MMRFNLIISHVPEKQLTTADILSQAPTESPYVNNYKQEQDSPPFVNAIVQSIPATKQHLQQIIES